LSFARENDVQVSANTNESQDDATSSYSSQETATL